MGNNYNDEYDYSSNYEYASSNVELTQNDMAQIDYLLKSGKKIEAIKLVKTRMDIGLVEAKTWIESYCSKTRNDNLVCPDCGSTSFDNENGVYYCQICGCQVGEEQETFQQIQNTNGAVSSNALGNSVLSKVQLIIYCYMALLAIIPVLRSLPYVSYYVDLDFLYLFLDLLYCFILIAFTVVAFMEMKGKNISKTIKIVLFILYALDEIITAFSTIRGFDLGGAMLNFIFYIIHIAFVWLVTFKFPQWIKK